ncbi:uncharacterized protein EDB93DRAFT_1249916 [Suillus bovinus]|uniref:uncharacterized protein n=1 Tax=Suillus bovinus TaxID=48563 RepID=UPI001B8658E0|nr:uncharacterized protein EDB93DRAFT_1249916 [Suillus bovinus]KAG2150347.1 hypothetical protein EDB93DRAFT_1249916 [Suillus bovinus]
MGWPVPNGTLSHSAVRLRWVNVAVLCEQVFVGLLSRAVPSHVLVVAQSILDFSYYAQLHIQTTESLEALQTALTVFHANKDILKELTVQEHFNILKLHQLSHYVQSITLFGAADGFNTELPEHLHIDFAKDSYHASNKRDYEEQMALWLQRQEAVFICSVSQPNNELTLGGD